MDPSIESVELCCASLDPRIRKAANKKLESIRELSSSTDSANDKTVHSPAVSQTVTPSISNIKPISTITGAFRREKKLYPPIPDYFKNEERHIVYDYGHGRVQSVKLLSEENSIPGSNISGGNRKGKSATVAFIDIRTATKALRAVNSMDGQDLQITYHEPGSAPPRGALPIDSQPSGDTAAASDVTASTLPQGNVSVGHGPGVSISNGPIPSSPGPGVYRQQRFPLQHGQSEDSSSHFYEQPKGGFSRGRGDGHGFHGVRGRRDNRHQYHNNRHSFPVDRNYRMSWNNYPNEGRYAPPVHSEGDERSAGPTTPSHPPSNETGPKGPRRPDSPASSVSSRHLPSKRHKSRSVSESGSSDRGSSPGSRSRSGSRSSVSTSVSSGRSRSPPHHSSGHYSRGGSVGGRYHQNSYSRQRYSRSRVVSRPADSRIRHGSRSPMAASPSSSTSSSPSPHRKIAVAPHSPSHSPSSAKSYSPSRSINQSGHHHHHHHPRRTPTNAEYQAAIRIRNLPIRSSDTSLKDGLYHEYKKHGKVAWVRVTGSASERYAVVCFKSVEHATRAVALSQDKQFFGCKIHVSPYYNGRGDDTAGGTDDDTNRTLAEDEVSSVPTRTVLITGLDQSVATPELKTAFDQYGDIVNIDIRKQGTLNQAICEFVDIASAIRAQWGRHVFKCRETRVSFCRNPATSSLLLDGTGGLHEKQVSSHCCQYGAILKVVMDPERILALVQFEEISSAQTAIRELRNWVIKGKHLHVDFASTEVIRRFLERVTNGVATGDNLSPSIHDSASSPINNFVGTGTLPNAFKETGGGIRRIHRRITGDEPKSAFMYRHELEGEGIKPMTHIRSFEDSNSPESASLHVNSIRGIGSGNLSGKVLSVESVGSVGNRNYRRHDSYISPVSPDPEHSNGNGKVVSKLEQDKCNSKIDLSCHETDSAVVTSSSDVIFVEKDETHNHHGSSSSSSLNGDEKPVSFDLVSVNRKSSVSSNKSNTMIVTVDGVSSTSPEPKTETVRKASPDPGIGVESAPRIISDTHIVTTGLIDPRKRSSESKIRRSSADSGNNVTVVNYHHGQHNSLQNSQGATSAGSLYSSNLSHIHHPNQHHQSTAALVSNNNNPQPGDESDDRPGTPLCDENPENFSSVESTPAGIRSPRTPGHSISNKTDPLSLPLPEFARQRSTNNNVTNMANMMKEPLQSSLRLIRSSSETNIIKSPIKSPIGGSGAGVCVGASVMTSSASESEIFSPTHVVDNNLSSFSSTTSTNWRDDPVDKNSSIAVENPSLEPPTKGDSASVVLSGSINGSSSEIVELGVSAPDDESKMAGVSLIAKEHTEELKEGGGTGSSSDSEGGSSPAASPVGDSLDERIKNLYEKYDQWNGNRSTVRAATVPNSSSLVNSSAGHESSNVSLNKSSSSETTLDAACSRIMRSRAVNLDEMLKQPSDIVKSLLAKRSVFDEDSKRLENFEDKYEAKTSVSWRVLALQRSGSTASTTSTASNASVPPQTPPPLTPTTPLSASSNSSAFPTTPISRLQPSIPLTTPPAGNLANSQTKPVHPQQSHPGNIINNTLVKLKDLSPAPGSNSTSGPGPWSKSETSTPTSSKGQIKFTSSLPSPPTVTPINSKSTNLPQTFPQLPSTKSVETPKSVSTSSSTAASSSSSSSTTTTPTTKTQDIQNHSSSMRPHSKQTVAVSNVSTSAPPPSMPNVSMQHGGANSTSSTNPNSIQSGIHHGIPRIVERSQSLDSRRGATGCVAAGGISASAGNSPNSTTVVNNNSSGAPSSSCSQNVPSRRISVDSHSSSQPLSSNSGSVINSDANSSYKSKETPSVTPRKLSESVESSGHGLKTTHRVTESNYVKEKGIKEKDLYPLSTAISNTTQNKDIPSKSKNDLNLIREEVSKVPLVHQETTVAVVATVQATLIPTRNEVVGSSSKDSKKDKEKEKKRRTSGSAAAAVPPHNNPSAHNSNIRSDSNPSSSTTKSSHSRGERKERREKDKESRNTGSSNAASTSAAHGENASKHDESGSNCAGHHHSHSHGSSGHHHRKEKKEKEKEHVEISGNGGGSSASGSSSKESHNHKKEKDKESAKVKRRLSSQDSEQEHKKPKMEKEKSHENRETVAAESPHQSQSHHHHHRIKSGSTSERRESRDSCSSLKDKTTKDKPEKDTQPSKGERSSGATSVGDNGNVKEKEHHHRSKSSSSSKHHHHGDKSRSINDSHSSSHSHKSKSDSLGLADKEKTKKDKDKEKVSPGKENSSGSGKSSSSKHHGHGSSHHNSGSKSKDGSASSKSKSSSKEKDKDRCIKEKEIKSNCGSILDSDAENENNSNPHSSRVTSSSSGLDKSSRDRDKHDKDGMSKRDRHKSGGDSSSAPGGNDSIKSGSRSKTKDQKKRRRIIDETESSESDDDDEEKQNKHHSIFEVVIDEYVSMYDKVKARSNRACKNNSTSKQQQEEQRKQDKLKEQFQQLKQSRAKREEKKRSTSIEERKSLANTSSDEGSQIDLQQHDSDAADRDSKQDNERDLPRDRNRDRDRDTDQLSMSIHALSSDEGDHMISHKGGGLLKEQSKSRLKLKSRSKGKSSSSEKGNTKQKGGRRSNKSSPLGGTSFPPSSSSIYFSHSDDDSQASSPQLLPPVTKKRKLSLKHMTNASSLTNISLSVDTKSSDDSVSENDSVSRKKAQSTRSHGQSHSQRQKKLRAKEIYSDSDSSEANSSRLTTKTVVPSSTKAKAKEKSRQKIMKKALFDSSESSDNESVSTPAPSSVQKKEKDRDVKEKETSKANGSSRKEKEKDKENKTNSTNTSRRKHHHSSVSSSKSSKSSRKQRNNSGDVSCDIGGHSVISKRESGSTMEDFLFGPMTSSSSSDAEEKPTELELERPKTPTIVTPINIFEETPLTSKKSKSSRSKQRKISHSFHSSMEEKNTDVNPSKLNLDTPAPAAQISSSSVKPAVSERKKKKHHREKRSKQRNDSQEATLNRNESTKQVKGEPVDYDSLFNSPASSPVSVSTPTVATTILQIDKEIPPMSAVSSTNLFFGIDTNPVVIVPPLFEKEKVKDPVLEECVNAIKQTGMFSTDEDDDDDDKLKIDINKLVTSSAEPDADTVEIRVPTPEVIEEEAVKEKKRSEEDDELKHSLFEQNMAIESIVCLDRKSPPPPTIVPDDEVNKDEIPKGEAAISQEETEDAVAALLETLEGDDTDDVGVIPSAPIGKPAAVNPSLQSPPTLRIIEEQPQVEEVPVPPLVPIEPETSPSVTANEDTGPEITWSYDNKKSPKDLQIDEGVPEDKDANQSKAVENDQVQIELNNVGLPKTPDIELRKPSTESIHEETPDDKKKPGRRASQKSSRQGSSETPADEFGVVMSADVYEFHDSDEEKKSKKTLTHASRHTPPIPTPVTTVKSPTTPSVVVVTPAAPLPPAPIPAAIVVEPEIKSQSLPAPTPFVAPIISPLPIVQPPVQQQPTIITLPPAPSTPKPPVVESLPPVKVNLPTLSPSAAVGSKTPPTPNLIPTPTPTRSTLDDTIDDVVRNFQPFQETVVSLPVVPMPKFSPVAQQVAVLRARTRSHSKDAPPPPDDTSTATITKVVPKPDGSPRQSLTPAPVVVETPTTTIVAMPVVGKPPIVPGEKEERITPGQTETDTQTLIDPQTGILMPMKRQSEEGQYVPLQGESKDSPMHKQHHLISHQILQMGNQARTAEIITKAMERPTVLEKLPVQTPHLPPQGLPPIIHQVPIQKNEGLPAMLAQQQQQMLQQQMQAQQIQQQQQHLQQQKQLQQHLQQQQQQKQNVQYVQQQQVSKSLPMQQQTIVIQSTAPSTVHGVSANSKVMYTTATVPFHAGKPGISPPVSVHTSIAGIPISSPTSSTFAMAPHQVKPPLGSNVTSQQLQPVSVTVQRPVFTPTNAPHPLQQGPYHHMALVRPQDSQPRPLIRQPLQHQTQLGGPSPSSVQTELVRIPQIPSATTITKINTGMEEQQQRKATIIQSHSNVILTPAGGQSIGGGAMVRAVGPSPSPHNIAMTHQQHQQHQFQTDLFKRCADGAPIGRVQEALGPSQPPRIDVGGSVVQTAAPSPKAGRVPQQHEQTPPQSTQQRVISQHQAVSFDSVMDNSCSVPLDLATPSCQNHIQNQTKSPHKSESSTPNVTNHTKTVSSASSTSPPYKLHGAQGDVRIPPTHMRQPSESSQYIPNQPGHQQMVYSPHFIPVTISGQGAAGLPSGQSSPFGLRVGSADKTAQLPDGKSVIEMKSGPGMQIIERTPQVHSHMAMVPHLQSPHPSDQRGSESPMVTSVYAGTRILYPTPVPSHLAPQSVPHHRPTFSNPYADLEERTYSQSPSYLQYETTPRSAAVAAAVVAAAAERDRELPPRVGSPYGSTVNSIVRRGSSPPPAHNLRYSGNHPLPAAEAPSSSNDRQRQTLVQTPPHASQVPPQGDSLLMLLQRYPIMWQGLLALKNDNAACQMHFVSGNMSVARDSLPSNPDGTIPPLRISQRMRLEQTQLEGVARKMQMEAEHCMLLALPCGRDHMDVLQQSNNLRHGFITYLQLKQAAGIVNIHHPISQQPAYVIHIFPSCDFANENLARIAPDLLHGVADIAHLLIVIATV